MSVSITVMPSSSTTTPALVTPDSPPAWSHAKTPSPSSVRERRRHGEATTPTGSTRLTLAAMSERSRNLPRRTCLSVPGSSEKMLGKAPGLGADMVFLDLEDSVAPLEKEARARQRREGDQRRSTGATRSCACG